MEHEPLTIAHFFAVLVAIWVGAKLAGELFERLKQPAVLGEIIVGILLGPSLLHIVPPDDHTLHLLAEVGVCLLLFEIGLETSLKEFVRVGLVSTLVAVIGVATPFLVGYYVIRYVEYLQWLTDITPTMYTLIAIFTGASLTATSVGITARVLADLHKLRTAEAKIILGAAVIDDILGIVILAVVSSLAAKTAAGVPLEEAVSVGSIGWTLLVAVGFLVAAILIGQKLVHPLFRLIQKMRVRGVLFVAAVSFALTLAFLADLAGSAMIIGAFAAGVLLAETDHLSHIEEHLKPVADIFTPLFFVLVGARIDVSVFAEGSALAIGLILFVVAVIGKLVAGLGAWGQRASKLAIGVGMIPRGEVGLIFAQEGAKTGLLDPALYAAITFMVITTTLIAPPLLSIVFAKVAAPGEET